MTKISFFSAIAALFAVGLGAFGAHALAENLAVREMTAVWKTAVFYHLIHAVAAWAGSFCPVEMQRGMHRAGLCWLGGILFFSGSLYVLSLGGPRWLGPITPLGGLCFMAGWALAAHAAWRSGAKASSHP
jgi:uncharacterized membrane protein YgdD (TMEM256/DUF423 family)